MTSENAKKNKCDRCGSSEIVVGLYRHANGWRCPSCIWNERENLIAWAKNLLSANDYTHKDNQKKQVVVVSRRNLDGLAEVVKEVTS